MSNGLDTVQKTVEDIRKTLGDLKTILDQIDKSRSVVCIVINATDIPLTFDADHHDHGGFATGPPVTINPRSGGAFGSQSKAGSIATGTEGYVRYVGGGLSLKCYWDNPWAGSNECDAVLESGDPTHFLTRHTAGAGDQKAEMQFILFQRPFQDSWRFCDKCGSMFYDGYDQKGVCPGAPERGVGPDGRGRLYHGPHEAQGYVFSLPHDAPASSVAAAQPDWRFCRKCSAMFFDGYPTKGVCIAGGPHEAQGFNFILAHDAPGPGQNAWRFCHKCFVLFFDGFPTKGHCPGGGGHEAQGFDFVLEHR